MVGRGLALGGPRYHLSGEVSSPANLSRRAEDW